MIANLGGSAEQMSGLSALQNMPQQSLASAHSAEVWALLGACVAAIIALVALLYKRINDDIKDVAQDIETNANTCDVLDKAMQDRCVAVDKLIHDHYTALHAEIAQIKTTMAQFATHQVMTNTEFSNLEEDIKRINDRLIKMETEHALCFGAYQRERQR